MKETDNPFGVIGSPIEGLKKPDDLDNILNKDTFDYLTMLAKIPSGMFVVETKSVDRQLWFQNRVKHQARIFLETAHAPTARSIGEEMHHLQRMIEIALRQRTQVSFTAIVTCLGQLTPEASAELSGYSFRELPKIEELRDGDDVALKTLYGLVPVGPDRENRRDDFVYAGTGSRELTREGRPATVRVEQFATWLVVTYHLAAGRAPSPREGSPFMAFSAELMGCLYEADKKSDGVRAFRRAVRDHKASQHGL
jgi:hypothetical protein